MQILLSILSNKLINNLGITTDSVPTASNLFAWKSYNFVFILVYDLDWQNYIVNHTKSITF